jgi:uncharacterized protein (TIGR02118 family)
MFEIVAVGNDIEAAVKASSNLGGVCYLADPTDERTLPFRTLIRCVTDNPQDLNAAAGNGMYLVFSRVIRERKTKIESGVPSPGVTAIFPLLHHPTLTHEQSDAHWRDVHAPLALQHHPGMWDYTQLSVTRTLSGPEIDGFALVSFESIDSMKERFFGDDNDRDVIYRDVASFADPNSPRRVVTTETIYGTRPPTPRITWPHE